MQSVSFKIWTRFTVSISYDDNHYTTGTSTYIQALSMNNLSVYLTFSVALFEDQEICVYLTIYRQNIFLILILNKSEKWHPTKQLP